MTSQLSDIPHQNLQKCIRHKYFVSDTFSVILYRFCVETTSFELHGSILHQVNRRNLGDLTPSLDVAVAVEGVLPHGTTLFVIARPLGGGMPFAVVRRPAVDFPLSIRLDDAVSMNPAQALSLANEVEVIVRISLSGSPMAQPGDWEWRSEPIEIALVTQPLQLDALLSPPLVGSPSAHQE